MAGILLTVCLYAALMLMAVALLLAYLWRWHRDGYCVDMYRRVVAPPACLFVPFDLEISHDELVAVVDEAERWQGAHNARRVVVVFNYVWDREDGDHSVTTHVSIHSVYAAGLKTVFRQFLRLPNGAIVEILGLPGHGFARLGQEVDQILARHRLSIEQLMQRAADYVRSEQRRAGAAAIVGHQSGHAAERLCVCFYAVFLLFWG